MKKIIRYISLLLCLTLCCSTLPGCGAQTQPVVDFIENPEDFSNIPVIAEYQRMINQTVQQAGYSYKTVYQSAEEYIYERIAIVPIDDAENRLEQCVLEIFMQLSQDQAHFVYTDLIERDGVTEKEKEMFPIIAKAMGTYMDEIVTSEKLQQFFDTKPKDTELVYDEETGFEQNYFENLFGVYFYNEENSVEHYLMTYMDSNTRQYSVLNHLLLSELPPVEEPKEDPTEDDPGAWSEIPASVPVFEEMLNTYLKENAYPFEVTFGDLRRVWEDKYEMVGSLQLTKDDVEDIYTPYFKMYIYLDAYTKQIYEIRFEVLKGATEGMYILHSRLASVLTERYFGRIWGFHASKMYDIVSNEEQSSDNQYIIVSPGEGQETYFCRPFYNDNARFSLTTYTDREDWTFTLYLLAEAKETPSGELYERKTICEEEIFATIALVYPGMEYYPAVEENQYLLIYNGQISGWFTLIKNENDTLQEIIFDVYSNTATALMGSVAYMLGVCEDADEFVRYFTEALYNISNESDGTIEIPTLNENVQCIITQGGNNAIEAKIIIFM